MQFEAVKPTDRSFPASGEISKLLVTRNSEVRADGKFGRVNKRNAGADTAFCLQISRQRQQRIALKSRRNDCN